MKTSYRILLTVSLTSFGAMCLAMEPDLASCPVSAPEEQKISAPFKFDKKYITDNLERHDKIEFLNHFAYKGDVEAVKKLLTVRAKNNAKDLDTANLMGITPLYSAQEGGNEEIKNLLIAAGAKPQANPPALPALHKAVYFGNMDEVKRLLAQDKQALEQVIDFKGSITPLYIALWTENPAMYELLLANGADKDFGGNPNQRFTPLYTAARFGHTRVVQYLLAHGADPNQVNKPKNPKNSNYTPLSVVARKNHLEAAKLLLKAGANVNQVNEEGKSPLAIAEDVATDIAQKCPEKAKEMEPMRNLLRENKGISIYGI